MALETVDVEFTPQDDYKGPGVRLKESARTTMKWIRKKIRLGDDSELFAKRTQFLEMNLRI